MVPNVMRWRGVFALRDGDIDLSEQFFKRAHAAGLAIAGRELAELAGRRGDRAEAARLWLQGTGNLMRFLPPETSTVVPAGLFGGTPEERERACALLEKYAKDNKNVSGLVPLMLAQMGHGAQAMQIAHDKVNGDDSDFMVYLFSPAGAPMRALPEYQAFIEAEGFPAVWAKYGPPEIGASK
jgi:hypothetical protein